MCQGWRKRGSWKAMSDLIYAEFGKNYRAISNNVYGSWSHLSRHFRRPRLLGLWGVSKYWSSLSTFCLPATVLRALQWSVRAHGWRWASYPVRIATPPLQENARLKVPYYINWHVLEAFPESPWIPDYANFTCLYVCGGCGCGLWADSFQNLQVCNHTIPAFILWLGETKAQDFRKSVQGDTSSG